MQKLTKIVCTIGPASDNKPMLKKLVSAGMNVARLNFSHGTHESHGAIISLVREVEKEHKTNLAIIQDLQGPRIRVGDLDDDIVLKKGQTLTIVPASKFKKSMTDSIPCQYERMYKDVKKGQNILIADGVIDLKITAIKGESIVTKVEVPGTIKSHKGINVPGAALKAPSITDKDKRDVVFGIAQRVSYVAMSFVKSADEVKELKAYMAKNAKGKSLPGIIVKVELPEAVKHFDAILEEADGIMVARGDLGLEIPAQMVPIVQKDLIARCIEAGKPVIVATQMLESMISNRRPTRAEVSDVANAVWDSTDATMLSGESASGKYPLEAVQIMAATIEAAEQSEYGQTECCCEEECSDQDLCGMMGNADAAAVVCNNPTLEVISLLSSMRSSMPIIVISKTASFRSDVALYRGVYAVEDVAGATKAIKQYGKLKSSKHIIVYNKKAFKLEKLSSGNLTKLIS